MGADKAFVDVDGRPMILRVVDALRNGGCTTIECQGGDAERLTSLGLAAHADDVAGDGPVPAIIQAVARHDGVVVIAATDLPDLDGATIDAVASEIDAGATAAVATADGPHLVVAFRGGASAAAVCREAAETSFRRMVEAIGAVAVAIDDGAVRNVNRPDDLG